MVRDRPAGREVGRPLPGGIHARQGDRTCERDGAACIASARASPGDDPYRPGSLRTECVHGRTHPSDERPTPRGEAGPHTPRTATPPAGASAAEPSPAATSARRARRPTSPPRGERPLSGGARSSDPAPAGSDRATYHRRVWSPLAAQDGSRRRPYEKVTRSGLPVRPVPARRPGPHPCSRRSWPACLPRVGAGPVCGGGRWARAGRPGGPARRFGRVVRVGRARPLPCLPRVLLTRLTAVV